MPEKEGRKSTEAQLRAIKRYQERHDETKLRMPKGKKEVYRKAAEEQGLSLTQYILKALEEKLQRDRDRGSTPDPLPDPLPDPDPAATDQIPVDYEKIFRQIKKETGARIRKLSKG